MHSRLFQTNQASIRPFADLEGGDRQRLGEEPEIALIYHFFQMESRICWEISASIIKSCKIKKARQYDRLNYC